MQINPAHLDALRTLYAENDYPTERIIKSEEALSAFTRELNARAAASYVPTEVAEILEYVRKTPRTTGGLPRLGRSYSGPKYLDN